MKRSVLSLLFGLILLIGMGGASSNAQQGTSPSGLIATVAPNKAAYLLNDPGGIDPMEITIALKNVSNGSIIVSKKFQEEPVHLLLTFIGPDGQLLTADKILGTGGEGPAPQVLAVEGKLVPVEPVDILTDTFAIAIKLPNARVFYTFLKAGNYTVRALVPVRTYFSIFQTLGTVNYAEIDAFQFGGALMSNTANFALVADADADGYAFPVPDSRISLNTVADCNDANSTINPGAVEIPGNGIDDDCNPATSDIVTIPPGTIIVKADKHTVGSGATPVVNKTPLNGLPVRLFNISDPCVSKLGVSWQKYKSIWLSCIPQANGIGTTGADGIVQFVLAPGNYVAIGEYDPNSAVKGDEIYMGVSAGGLTSGMTMQKYFQLIVTAAGKQVPAKYTVRTGSQLLIIEPEYVEWSGTQELYPFVLETMGDWTVTVSVSPPPGFVPDNNSLTATVNTTISAVQFTITDVGSKWVSTGVTYNIKHKGKSEMIRSQVGVKLSEKLAKQKGLSRLGEVLKEGK